MSRLFEKHRESEYCDFPDAEERIVGIYLGESKPKDKQEPTFQSAPGPGHWQTAMKFLGFVAGVAGVGLALYAAYKYFRWLCKRVDTIPIKLCVIIIIIIIIINIIIIIIIIIIINIVSFAKAVIIWVVPLTSRVSLLNCLNVQYSGKLSVVDSVALTRKEKYIYSSETVNIPGRITRRIDLASFKEQKRK